MLAYDPEDRPSSREVERRCRALRAEVDDPWLRDWAETVVPIARAEDQALEQDDFSGSVVVESTKSGLTVDGQPVVVTEDKSGLSQENGTTFVPANWGSEAKSPQQAPKSSRGGAGMVVGGVSVVGCLALTLGGVLLIGLIGIVAAWYSMQVEERPVNEVAGVSSGPSSTGPVELEVPDKPIPPGEEFGPPKGPSSRVQASLSRPWKTQKLPIDKGYVTYSDKTTLVVTYGAGPMAIMAERWEKAFVGLGWEKQYSVNSEQAFTRTFTHPDVKKDLAVSVVQSSGDVMVSCSMY